MGRGPRATISFTYCMARAELKAGAGLGSFGTAEASADVTEVEGVGSFGAASFSRAQANRVKAKHNAAKISSRGRPSCSLRLVNLIAPFAPPSPSAVWDAP